MHNQSQSSLEVAASRQDLRKAPSLFNSLNAVIMREFTAYTSSPLVLIFGLAFLLTAASFTFHLGSFFDRDQADLLSFFRFLPWISIIFAPALAMRVWSEDIRNGSIELLITLPLSPYGLILGRFLALWLVGCATIALTFPLWIAVSYLGDPDHGMILSGYIGGFLLIGAYLALTSTISIFTSNQIVALVPGVALSFFMTVMGSPLILRYLTQWLPQAWIDIISNLSLLLHFENFMRGEIDFRSVVYFIGFILLCLYTTRLGLQRLERGG